LTVSDTAPTREGDRGPDYADSGATVVSAQNEVNGMSADDPKPNQDLAGGSCKTLICHMNVALRAGLRFSAFLSIALSNSGLAERP
jgi:hypothetical protein